MRLKLTIFLALVPASLQAAELRELRLWDSPENTQVVFDLKGRIEHKVFTLTNPDRIVIDISGVESGGARIANQVMGKGLVRHVRAGPRDDGSLRVVLDVAEAINPRSYILEPTESYGYRLVLDLYGRPQLEVPAPQITQVVSGATTAAPAAAPTPAPAPLPPPSLAPRKATPIPQAVSAFEVPPPPRNLQLIDKPIVIAIDAGHGGEDPGAIGRGGLQEKTATLAMARRLAALVNAEPGFRAVLTREGDYFIGLRERVTKSRKAQADLFVSIHCNAQATQRDARGSAVYVLSSRGASSEQARWLAHKENSADLIGGVGIQGKDNELAAVLIDLSQTSTMEASFDLGNRLLGALAPVNGLQKVEVQQAGFAVLKALDVPSVLVETAFITNAQDERLLGDPSYQEQMMRSLMTGIRGYFKSYRPQQQIVQEPQQQKVRSSGTTARAVEVSLKPRALPATSRSD